MIPEEICLKKVDRRRGGWVGDQHHAPEPLSIEGAREHGQDRPVGRAEPGPVDLSLQNVNLVAEGEDLSVTLVARHQQKPETSNQ